MVATITYSVGFIGNFVGVYLKPKVKCVTTKGVSQIAGEKREERLMLVSCYNF